MPITKERLAAITAAAADIEAAFSFNSTTATRIISQLRQLLPAFKRDDISAALDDLDALFQSHEHQILQSSRLIQIELIRQKHSWRHNEYSKRHKRQLRSSSKSGSASSDATS